jgi:DNA-directed RNA polymerase specialized sigma24 family protein
VTAQRGSACTGAAVPPPSAANRNTRDIRQIEAAGLPERAAQVSWGVEVLPILDSLDYIDRSALRLIYSDGLTQTEVARELALPEATIRRCVAHGMRRLAGRLTAGTTWK